MSGMSERHVCTRRMERKGKGLMGIGGGYGNKGRVRGLMGKGTGLMGIRGGYTGFDGKGKGTGGGLNKKGTYNRVF
jgi:hypothetical protein